MIKDFHSSYKEQDHFKHFESIEPYLIKTNFLSEFKTDLEKAKVRKNLGIVDLDTLTWGNIKGDIAEQQDLIKYIDKLLSVSYKTPSASHVYDYNFSNITNVQQGVKECLNYLYKNGQEHQDFNNYIKYLSETLLSNDENAPGIIVQIKKSLEQLRDSLSNNTESINSILGQIDGITEQVASANSKISEIYSILNNKQDKFVSYTNFEDTQFNNVVNCKGFSIFSNDLPASKEFGFDKETKYINSFTYYSGGVRNSDPVEGNFFLCILKQVNRGNWIVQGCSENSINIRQAEINSPLTWTFNNIPIIANEENVGIAIALSSEIKHKNDIFPDITSWTTMRAKVSTNKTRETNKCICLNNIEWDYSIQIAYKISFANELPQLPSEEGIYGISTLEGKLNWEKINNQQSAFKTINGYDITGNGDLPLYYTVNITKDTQGIYSDRTFEQIAQAHNEKKQLEFIINGEACTHAYSIINSEVEADRRLFIFYIKNGSIYTCHYDAGLDTWFIKTREFAEYSDIEELQNQIESKQSKLISGENLATINGHNLLEGGDIVISGDVVINEDTNISYNNGPVIRYTLEDGSCNNKANCNGLLIYSPNALATYNLGIHHTEKLIKQFAYKAGEALPAVPAAGEFYLCVVKQVNNGSWKVVGCSRNAVNIREVATDHYIVWDFDNIPLLATETNVGVAVMLSSIKKEPADIIGAPSTWPTMRPSVITGKTVENNSCICLNKGDWASTLQAAYKITLEEQLPTQQNLSNKQDKLISGVNIATINGHNLLEETNVQIESGSGNLATNELLEIKGYRIKTVTGDYVKFVQNAIGTQCYFCLSKTGDPDSYIYTLNPDFSLTNTTTNHKYSILWNGYFAPVTVERILNKGYILVSRQGGESRVNLWNLDKNSFDDYDWTLEGDEAENFPIQEERCTPYFMLEPVYGDVSSTIKYILQDTTEDDVNRKLQLMQTEIESLKEALRLNAEADAENAKADVEAHAQAEEAITKIAETATEADVNSIFNK